MFRVEVLGTLNFIRRAPDESSFSSCLSITKSRTATSLYKGFLFVLAASNSLFPGAFVILYVDTSYGATSNSRKCDNAQLDELNGREDMNTTSCMYNLDIR